MLGIGECPHSFTRVRLREAARLTECPAGATLFRQGGRPRAMYFVLDGEVRLLRRFTDAISVRRARRRRREAEAATLMQRLMNGEGLTAQIDTP